MLCFFFADEPTNHIENTHIDSSLPLNQENVDIDYQDGEDILVSKLEVKLSEPEVKVSEPEVKVSEPEVKSFKPNVAKQDSEMGNGVDYTFIKIK